MTTGEKIKELRKALGMTQEELGEKIGVQKAAINKYETGVVVNLKQATISALAKALGVSPLDLLGGSDGSTLSFDESRLVTAYRAADPIIQKAALKMLEDNPVSSKVSPHRDTGSGQTA